LRTLQAQIAEEFSDREKLVRAENIALRKEKDQVENNYCKAASIVAQHKQDEVSLKRVVVELCSELPDMQLEADASILDNIQKVVVRTQELVVRMDRVEDEYKAMIEELEK
jgi:urease gamma subunit